MIGTQPVPLAGGVNTYLDPALVPDGNVTKAENVAPSSRGFPGTRPSLSFVRELIPHYEPWNSTLSGYGSFLEFYWEWARYWRPLKFIFSDTAGELVAVMQYVGSSQTIVTDTNGLVDDARNIDPDTVVLMAFPGQMFTGGNGPRCVVLGEPGHYSLFNFDGIIYAFGPGSNGARVELSTDGTLGPLVGWNYVRNDFEGVGNDGFNPSGAAIVRDRTVFWKGATVFWSDRNDPLSLADNMEVTGSIVVTAEDLEDITAVAELGTSADGSPVQSVAAVWTRSRMYLLLGEPSESDQIDAGGGVIGSLQINKLSVEAGCVSQASVARTPYGTFWVGSDDVWFMPHGALPIRVGTAIRDRILAQPAGLSWKIHASYDANFLKVALFAPGQGPTSASPLQEQWWLDLTNGPPQNAEAARWFGPQTLKVSVGATDEYGTFCVARDQRGVGDGRMYSLQPYIMPGNQNYSVYGMSLCAFGAPTGVDSSAPKYAPSVWQASQAVYVGDIWVPQGDADTLVAPTFVCTTAGFTDADPEAEPDWAASGATLTDGSVVYRPIYYADGTGVTAGVLSGRMVRENSELSHHTPIEIRTKEYTLGDPITEKLLDGMELSYLARQPTKLTYSTNPDQTENSRILEGVSGPQYDVDVFPIIATRSWKRKLLTPQASRRFSAQSAQAKIVQTPGIIIVEGVNDSFNFAAPYRDNITIAAGYYTNLLTVWNAMKAAALLDPVGPQYLQSNFDLNGGPLTCRFGVRGAGGGAIYTTAPVRDLPLMRMFGYHPDQIIQDTIADPSQFLYGEREYEYTLCPELQLSALNIRFGVFGRRAT